MTAGIAHGIWTLVLVITFVAICIWTFSPSRKSELDEAGRIPLDDDPTNPSDSING